MLTNPTYQDFKNNQNQGMVYGDNYYPSDILRTISLYIKYLHVKNAAPGPLNKKVSGLDISAEYDSDNNKVIISVSKGAGIFDNQPIEFVDDMQWILDDPGEDKTYYAYVRYRYVDDYPANYAEIVVYAEKVNLSEYTLLGSVDYKNSDHSFTINPNPDVSAFTNVAGFTYMDHVPTLDEIDTYEIVFNTSDNKFYTKTYDKDNNLVIIAISGGAGGLEPIFVNSDVTAELSKIYVITDNCTITLPAGPDNGARIDFMDGTGHASDYNMIIKPGSNDTINGDSEGLSLNSDKFKATLIYNNGDWKIGL